MKTGVKCCAMITRQRSLLNSDPVRLLYPGALAHLTIELCNNYLPVVYPILRTTLGLSYTQIGFVTLVAGVGTSLVQPFFGYLSDRWDTWRIIVLSIAWTGSLMGLVGLIPSYWLLLILVGLASLGSAAYHPAGASVAGSITTTRRGATLSVFSVSGTFGTALSPLLITTVIARMGLPGTTLLIPIALVASLLIYQQSHWRGAAQTGSTAAGSHMIGGQPQVQDGSLVGLVLVILAVMCRSWFQVSLVTYLPEWLQSQGWSPASSGQMLTVLLISISAGTLVGGILSDRIGRWQVLALSLGLLGPMGWLFLRAGGTAQLAILALTGALIGASFPVVVVMAQETWPRGVGLASALVMGLGWLPGGIGAAFTGFLADQTSLSRALGWLIVAPILGLACALMYAVVWRRHRKGQARP
jgi:FSR family fosmidomycin resistance protein-like MFS transporter